MFAKVLVASPIRQHPDILNEFLISLEELDKEDLIVHYCFVDDNVDFKSKQILENFCSRNKVYLLENDLNLTEEYVCDHETHHWKDSIIEKVARYKNRMLDFARINNFNYIFFVDSDIVMHPKTLKQLLNSNRDIISNIFWTQWIEGGVLEPQVWLQDVGKLYIKNPDEKLSKFEIRQKSNEFRNMLKIPGIYKVGGLGACTLISGKVLQTNISFSRLENISFWGEDRHFCIRAVAHGFDLFVDTHYPSYHIYTLKHLSGINEYKESGYFFSENNTLKMNLKRKVKSTLIKVPDIPTQIRVLLKSYYKILLTEIKSYKRVVKNDNKITLSMVVKNEEGRYIEEVLKHAIKYVDNVVIINDGSTDRTEEICENILKDIPHKIITNKISLFSKEYKLRKQQWDETLKMDPDWILALDADEVFEDEMILQARELIRNNNVDAYSFKLFDMWNDNYYREDIYWNAHKRYTTFLIRYQPHFKYRFNKTNQHCGRLPKNINNLQTEKSDIRLKHFGWARKEDRHKKFERYMKLDGKGRYGIIEQYESILDKNPNLVLFDEK
ncbi:glycosyltransferase [Paenisporosarcina quisquiliarum]|uniref:glycosyltransferase n=1 Tax=Paenisporosarcina quisquiliarum TaxID=365346 RepID=UPI003736CD2A